MGPPISVMRVGIDLGGTKIEGVVVAADHRIPARRRIATPRDDYAAILASIRELVCGLESDVGRSCSVGVGMPGILSPYSGLVKNSNTIVLNGKSIDRDLAALLDRDLRFENDANCFALSEALDGAARGQSVVFGVIIGTGTGGGIVIDRKILRGANAIAGEWGHNPLPWAKAGEVEGPDCYCGKRGCLETFLSGSGLSRAFSAQGLGGIDAREIAARADAGEARASAAIAIYADRLARGLSSVINVVDPDVIVLGGGLSNIALLYDLVPPLLRKYVFSDQVRTRVVPARYGDSSGVRGAAWLWSPEPV